MNKKIPFDFASINLHSGMYNPSSVHTQNNATQLLFARSLFQRFCSVYKWNIPKSWDKAFFEYVLYLMGFICILPTDKYGIIPQISSLYGVGVFYQPTRANVVQNLVNEHDLLIGKDCAIIKFSPDYMGINELINYYSEKLTIISQAFDMNIINSKLAYVISAKNKSSAQTVKEILDRINSGEPAVIANTKSTEIGDNEPWNEWHRDIKSSYIAGELNDAFREIMNQFDTEIGIPNTNINKQSGIGEDEINANNTETFSRALVHLNSMKEGVKIANELYPELNLSVEIATLNNPEGGAYNGENNINRVE